LPTGTPAADLEWSPAASTLRQLVDEAQSILEARDSIETQMKDVKCDMGMYTPSLIVFFWFTCITCGFGDTVLLLFSILDLFRCFLQCSDTVVWATGRASGL